VPLANLPVLSQGAQLELGLGETTDPITPDAWRSIGSVSFDPGSYSGLSVYWQGIGSVSNTAATLSLKLRNVTDASDVDTRTFTALAPATSTSSALSLPSATKLYEAWIRLTGGGPYDVGTLGSARLVIQ
jgi:hypothetical protein